MLGRQENSKKHKTPEQCAKMMYLEKASLTSWIYAIQILRPRLAIGVSSKIKLNSQLLPNNQKMARVSKS